MTLVITPVAAPSAAADVPLHEPLPALEDTLEALSLEALPAAVQLLVAQWLPAPLALTGQGVGHEAVAERKTVQLQRPTDSWVAVERGVVRARLEAVGVGSAEPRASRMATPPIIDATTVANHDTLSLADGHAIAEHRTRAIGKASDVSGWPVLAPALARTEAESLPQADHERAGPQAPGTLPIGLGSGALHSAPGPTSFLPPPLPIPLHPPGPVAQAPLPLPAPPGKGKGAVYLQVPFDNGTVAGLVTISRAQREPGSLQSAPLQLTASSAELGRELRDQLGLLEHPWPLRDEPGQEHPRREPPAQPETEDEPAPTPLDRKRDEAAP
jgi:hypothetical protein